MQNRTPTDAVNDWLESTDNHTRRGELESKFRSFLRESSYNNLENDGYMKDFIKMTIVLSNPDIVFEQLAKLSRALEQNLRDRGFIDNDEIRKKEGKSHYSNYKSVANFFDEWAKAHGYNQELTVACVDVDGNSVDIDLPAQTPTVAENIKMKAFQFMLSNGYLFCDKGAGQRHGEFTHMLAVYVLTEANQQSKFLDHSVADLYRKLGSPECEAEYPNIIAGSTLWDPIFDDFQGASLNSPELLNLMVAGKYHKNAIDLQPDQIARIKILRQIVLGRYDKREKIENEEGAYAQEKNVAKKGGIWVNGILFQSHAEGRQDYMLADTPSLKLQEWLDENQLARDMTMQKPAKAADTTDHYDTQGGSDNPDKADSDTEVLKTAKSGASKVGMFGSMREEQDPEGLSDDEDHDLGSRQPRKQ